MLGRLLGGVGHDLRHRDLRIVDRYPGQRFCRRKPAAAISSRPGTSSARCRSSRRSIRRRSPRSPTCCGAWRCPNGPPSIRRGRVGDCMYFIAEGEVQVDIEPTPVRLGTGAFFGEIALLGNSVRSANVSTTTALDLADSRPCRFPHPDGASSGACPHHRSRGQTAPERKSTPARAAAPRRRIVNRCRGSRARGDLV